MSRKFIEEYITVHVDLLGMPYAEYEKLTETQQEALSTAAYSVVDAASARISQGYGSLSRAEVPSTHPGDNFMVPQYELCSGDSAEMEAGYMAHSIGIFTEQQLDKETVQEFVDYALKIWAEVAAESKVPFHPIHVTRQKAFRETENTIEPIKA
ncbi:hypothetical protein [Comamonas thiooxydans]|uniref:hypothetical protein n=1 Tax=Comamonas thiooxydans TaxID=363952 RepID=UPI000B40CD9F|nr:hypothetical protein [Comamonas thiooxydans]